MLFRFYAMPLQPANQPQIIRSTQKDDYYQNCLRNNASEAFQTLAGSKKWLEWRREIELLSDLAYYCLTTFAGFQTLGEEYVSILQVDPTKRKVPSRARRAALICLHVFVPYLLDRTLARLERELQAETAGPRAPQTRGWNLTSFFRERAQWAVGRLAETQRRTLLHATYVLRQGITFAHRLHVALFYINGAFYHLGKRVSGVCYLRVRGLPGDDRAVRTSYKLLGAVSVLQLALTVALQINNFRQRQRARQEWKQYRNLASSGSSPDLLSARTSRCVLCLEQRRHSTATPCGHLFCWECITEWCNTKEECPLCREKFKPHRLVYLRNYK
ncbi:peroxisome biogenesis factor 10-like isoform X2 [Polyodon spathula]|uniref:peroxisome biogenesis factor 10-like isoform X2 n=1 Tax=Polyodon spathula TaxID=7913 RepID=UPI001B7E0C08|nr:peroxisome biogenesis factor 10-like isoform X2 [Polyodon spathula]